MARTRSNATAGNKHKLDQTESQPPAKAQKKDEQQEEKKQDEKRQLTMAESLNGNTKDNDPEQDTEESKPDDEEEFKKGNGKKQQGKKDSKNKQQPKKEARNKQQPKKDDKNEQQTKEEKNDEQKANKNSNDEQKSDAPTAQSKDQPKDQSKDQSTAIDPHGRTTPPPSNILEKGIIYFFLRGRVNIPTPTSTTDIARTHLILRPLPLSAALTTGPLGDAAAPTSRLLAIPKKRLPQSGRDRWLAFVEKSHASFETLRDDFLASNDYDTKTVGKRHTPAATPFGQGVYAITTTGKDSHLAYLLTLPAELGEVQTELGLKERGSWILSTRNPQFKAPQGAALPGGPDFSKEILDEFRSLRWMGTLPKHLVPNAQILLVGESSGLEKALPPDEKSTDDGEQDPIEEMEKLEDEDTERMESLGKNASEAIFADLEASAKDHPDLQTSF